MSETSKLEVGEAEKAGEEEEEGGDDGGDEGGEPLEGAADAAEAREQGEADRPAEQAGPAKRTSAVSKRNLAEAMASIALGGTNLVLRPAVVRYGDMPKAMENYCIELAHLSMMKFYKENEMARFIKKSVEDKYKDLWHVLVGKNFGLSVTHEEKRYIYFYCGQMAFVIFKAGMPF